MKRTSTIATVASESNSQPVTYSYNYGPSSVSVQAQAPSTIGSYSIYYSVTSPVPAAQYSTYIPSSPAASHAIPVSQP